MTKLERERADWMAKMLVLRKAIVLAKFINPNPIFYLYNSPYTLIGDLVQSRWYFSGVEPCIISSRFSIWPQCQKRFMTSWPHLFTETKNIRLSPTDWKDTRRNERGLALLFISQHFGRNFLLGRAYAQLLSICTN